MRSWKQSLWRGVKCACPACGQATLYDRYLKTHNSCPSCKTDLAHHRADDAPPYFTMMIVGHVVVPAMLVVEKLWSPALWIHAALWLPLTLLMTLMLLPSVKGAIIGLQWAFGMHGFSSVKDRNSA